LDSALQREENISIIQLDVEECEQRVLMGSLGILFKHKPILIVESLRGEWHSSYSWFGRNVLSFGYEMTQKVHDNLIFRHK
jgi:hypothetical protein